MENYVPRLYDFLRRLRDNNNRPWFQEHKSEYQELREAWLEDVDRMIAAMAVWEPDVAGQFAKDCAYRIYRDTRFSPDKTPYKIYFSAAVSPYGKNAMRAGYYLEIGLRPGGSGLYGGLYCPDTKMLKKIRNAIVDNIEEFEEIVNEPRMQRVFPGWIGEKLKTIPKGWPKDHPQAPLLRLKDYGKMHFCEESFFADTLWPEKAAEIFALLKPFNDFLNYSIDE